MLSFIRHIKKISTILLLELVTIPVWATHNRAGEISIEQIGNCNESLTIRATIVTYTKASSRPADRDSLTICWGDGTCVTVGRVNGPGSPPQGELLENDVKKNIYIGIHTYPARSTYVISMTDPNRNGGILNINYPNSEQIKFHIQTTYTFPNPQFQGCNNTPVLLQPPLDIGCVGQPFIHNPNAYDEDGDSLAYRLIVPFQDAGMTVPNYRFPNEISPGPDNQLTINEVTGDLVWKSPQRAGEYNVTMIIIEYRDGIPIDTMVRDMQILVENCNNLPPEIETSFDEICVIAGEQVSIRVVATAPLIETNQKVSLTALGGPFEVGFSPATFTPGGADFQDDPVIKTFIWNTTCEHISDQFYTVVFKATDNYFVNGSGLSTLKTVRIKVIGPPPEPPEAISETGLIKLSWGEPYFCKNTADDYFRGFSVYRRIGRSGYEPDTCNPGLNGWGYELLTPVPIRSYQFIDSMVERGRTYCYRIVGNFAKTTPGGLYTFNPVVSLPSKDICIQLKQDVPLIIKADVLTTSPSQGTVEVCWAKPLPFDLDTLANPGPYTYEVLHNNQPIGVSFTGTTFAEVIDTCFIHTDLNTLDLIHLYKINFYTGPNQNLFGASSAASTVFLKSTPTDKTNLLTWTFEVPWSNTHYEVYRNSGERIATVTEPRFTDINLINGQEYCYYVRSYGSYGTASLTDTLINHSQIVCSIPIDNVPPCPPSDIQIQNLCNTGSNQDCNNRNPVNNTIEWKLTEACGQESSDVAGFKIYFSPKDSGEQFVLIADIANPNASKFIHEQQDNLAGCYYIIAYDRNGNESESSAIVCVDNCPNYQLPNTFTPNGDGQNDLFTPYPYCFIDKVDFKVFNRWGVLVFSTNNPDINWDGTNLNGQKLPDATYYYTCTVFEKRLDLLSAETTQFNGFIELITRN
jgi:gliding motility-associated-like protein